MNWLAFIISFAVAFIGSGAVITWAEKRKRK